MARNLEDLELFTDAGVRVVVEATAGSRNKLKYDAATHTFELHHVLPAGTAFPLDFGFLPRTRGGDGDPLDALVFADEPVPPGTVVPCRLVGVIAATQAPHGQPAVRNDRFLAVASHGHLHAGWTDIGDIPAALLDQIEAFFVSYNAQRGQAFTPTARHGAGEAMRLLKAGAVPPSPPGRGSG